MVPTMQTRRLGHPAPTADVADRRHPLRILAEMQQAASAVSRAGLHKNIIAGRDD
jgi:hypothetical protein